MEQGLLRTACRYLLLIFVAIALTGCLDIEQRMEIADSGSVTSNMDIKVDPRAAGMVVPMLKEQLLKDGFKLLEETTRDGAPFLRYRGEFLHFEDFKPDGFKLSYTKSESDGKTKYLISIMVARKAKDPSLKHHLTLQVPGTIQSTNGQKISSDEIRLDLTIPGTYDVISETSALSMSKIFSGFGSGAIWIAAAILGLVGVVLVVVVRRRATPAKLSTSHFCTQCGADIPPNSEFCEQCGAPQNRNSH